MLVVGRPLYRQAVIMPDPPRQSMQNQSILNDYKSCGMARLLRLQSVVNMARRAANSDTRFPQAKECPPAFSRENTHAFASMYRPGLGNIGDLGLR